MPTRIVSSFDQLPPNAWCRLWLDDSFATPFQSPGWLIPWWRSFGSGQLLCIAAFHGDSLAALAPLFLHSWNNRRQVTFLGNGLSDRLQFLGNSDVALLNALAAQRDRFDLCDLQDIHSSARLLRSNPPLPCSIHPQYHCSAIPLPDNPDAFTATLPHGLRRNLQRYLRHLSDLGECRFETSSGLEEPLQAALQFHRHGLEESQIAFLREALTNLREIARLNCLRLDGRIVAVNLVFVHNARAYGYLTAFDPALASCSPGALLLHFSIQSAIREGARAFDFLRGDEPYKQLWGARPYQTMRLLLWP